MAKNTTYDLIALTSSLVCAIHCALGRLDLSEFWEVSLVVLLVSMAHFVNWKLLRSSCKHKSE